MNLLKTFWISKNVAFGPIPIRSDYEDIIEHFDVVVSLIEKEEYKLYSYQPEYFKEKGNLEVYKIYTPDYRAPKLIPSLEILQKILEYDLQNKKVYIHCVGGLGRSGALAAAYLVYKDGTKADEAIKKIRKIRPGSVQSEEQKAFVQRVYTATFGVNKEKISKIASKAKEILEKNTFILVNKRTEISMDLVWGLFREESLGPIAFVSSLAYFGILSNNLIELSLENYNIFSQKDNINDPEKRETIEMIIKFSDEVVKEVGDGIAYFNVENLPSEIIFTAYCLTYCEDVIKASFEKFKANMGRSLQKEVTVSVEYVW